MGDTIAPDSSKFIRYAEGLSVGYRNPNFKAAFPFGHGLAYTTFEYRRLWKRKSCQAEFCIAVEICNTGTRSSKTIPQLYLQFPLTVGYAVPILKGFHKTDLIYPGSTTIVTFELTERDMSFWHMGRWVKV